MKHFFYSVVLFAFSAGIASADETSAKTRATLLELGLLPDLVLTNETELASSPIPITVNTNGCELTLFNYSALRGTTDPERPDMFKIVFKPGDAPALLLGTGFVHHGTTNCLVEMAAPLAVTPMPIHMLKEYWVHMPEVDGVCLRGTPTNTSPTRVFLARRGAVCILKNSTISNLVDLAGTVCDVLSPQSGMPESIAVQVHGSTNVVTIADALLSAGTAAGGEMSGQTNDEGNMIP